MQLKLLKKIVIQKTAVATGDLIGNKASNWVTKVSRSSTQINSKTISSEHDKKIPQERTYLQKKDRKLLAI